METRFRLLFSLVLLSLVSFSLVKLRGVRDVTVESVSTVELGT
jgi:hypothetical protein